MEFIKNEDNKYVRLLGALYMRLVGKPLDVYQYLEPLYNDYRRVRFRSLDGTFVLRHVDEFIQELLTKARRAASGPRACAGRLRRASSPQPRASRRVGRGGGGLGRRLAGVRANARAPWQRPSSRTPREHLSQALPSPPLPS